MNQPSAENFLSGSSKSASFKDKPIGHSYAGFIVEPPKVTQQTDPDDGSLLTWPNGEPKWQLVVKIQTDLREDEDDDGVRTIYVKGKSLTDGAREAAKPYGGKLLVGGHLTVTYVGDGEKTKKAFNAPKLYRVTYLPPEPSGDSAAFLGGPETMAATHAAGHAAAAVASSPAPAAAVAQHASPGVDMAALLAAAQQNTAAQQLPEIPAFYAGKVTREQWAALPDDQRRNLIAAAQNAAAMTAAGDSAPF